MSLELGNVEDAVCWGLLRRPRIFVDVDGSLGEVVVVEKGVEVWDDKVEIALRAVNGGTNGGFTAEGNESLTAYSTGDLVPGPDVRDGGVADDSGHP